MTHGSLFSGIGGFDLASSWMGWENVFQCEKDAFCRKVLRYYWPRANLYEDVKSFEAEKYGGRIDVLTGGFPCQPFSSAGRRKGTSDDRYLWPEMYRIIGAVRPSWIVGENVLGLVNWGRGMVFEQVQADLEAEGYQVWTFVLPAAGVGAPHKRDRVWIVANSDGHRGFEGGLHKTAPGAATKYIGKCDSRNGRDPWEKFPVEPPVCTRNDGVPAGLDGITFPKWRDGSIKGAGNAIVPQVAWELFKVIDRIEKGRV